MFTNTVHATSRLNTEYARDLKHQASPLQPHSAESKFHNTHLSMRTAVDNTVQLASSDDSISSEQSDSTPKQSNVTASRKDASSNDHTAEKVIESNNKTRTQILETLIQSNQKKLLELESEVKKTQNDMSVISNLREGKVPLLKFEKEALISRVVQLKKIHP